MLAQLLRRHVLPPLIAGVYTLLRFTWRMHLIETPAFKAALASGAPLVFSHWHGDELALVWLLRRYHCCVMTSTSKDGELMDAVLRCMGIFTSRGSSTRGGVGALKGILRLSKKGFRPTVAIDGPKGPYHKAKAGVFEISKLTGAMLCPAGAAAAPRFVFERSWNKAYLPLPFAKVVIVMGSPLNPVKRTQDGRDPQLAESLERAMAAAQHEASNIIASL